jgi:hypothetical protein
MLGRISFTPKLAAASTLAVSVFHIRHDRRPVSVPTSHLLAVFLLLMSGLLQMEGRMRRIMTTLIVGFGINLLALPALPKTRTVEKTGTVAFWVFEDYMEKYGVVPLFYPVEVSIRADYTTSYNSKTRKTTTTISRLDQSVVVRGARRSPCPPTASVTTLVSDRTSDYLYLKEGSPGTSRGSYLTGSSNFITGFVYWRSISIVDPRLETTGAVASYQCLGSRKVTAKLNLP